MLKTLPVSQSPLTTLDELVGDDIPMLIKIDVEGHELAVLRGAERTLSSRRLQAVVMEINGSGERYGVSDQNLVDHMRAHGFTDYAYDSMQRRLVDASFSEGNTIFIRDPRLVADTVRAAKQYRLSNGTI